MRWWKISVLFSGARTETECTDRKPHAWNIAWVAFVIGGLLCGVVAVLLGREN